MALFFFEKLQSLFSQMRGQESKREVEKKKLLRIAAHDISKSRYKKFFKIKIEEADAEMAKFFFDIYKSIGKAQVFLQKMMQSSHFKACVVESFMDEKLLGMLENLTAEAIAERGKTMRPETLGIQIKKELAALFEAFDPNVTKHIDDFYNIIQRLINFVTFNYYDLLVKFDNNMLENDFDYQPQFTKARGEKISGNLKDFMEVAYAMDISLDWKRAIRIINAYKNVEIISIEQWHKLLVKLQDVQNSSIFLLIVRFVEKSPVWQVKPNIPKERIVGAWLEERRLEAQEAIEKLLAMRRNAVVSAIATKIFGDAEMIDKLANYTNEANESYLAKKLDGYTHTIELRYLRAFMQTIFKNDVYPIIDLFLVKGQWANHPLSQHMSEAVHLILAIPREINAFDQSLASSTEYGDKLRLYVAKSEREKSYIKYSNNLFKTINSAAQDIINSTGQSLIVIGKYIKAFIDDKQQKKHEFILNWKELEASTEIDILVTLQNCYKKIYDIIRLLQIFSNSLGSDSKNKE
ncbi:MAG: DUF5312 domain-containing protein [Treponema sp.]|jgi:hypothetical protein|nr:DUF5312 domain-containing protein [Treponema sp.]